MARKKDERLVKQAYKEERKAKAAQKKVAESGGAAEPYLQPNDDHFVSFKKQLATMGLMLRDIPGDGNCLFRALNDQLEGHSRNHHRLRQDTVRFMVEHRQDFEPFVEDDLPFQTHIRNLSQPGTYGGHDALVAFARMLKVNIVIHQLNSPLWQIEGGPAGCQQLHLSYHNGEHYSSVRRVGDTSESAANIRINVTPDAVAGTSANGKKNQERRFPWQEDRCVNGDEDIVQRISDRTGCKDLSMISEALVENDGDEHATVDYITSLMMVTESAVGFVDETDGQPVGAVACATSSGGSENGGSQVGHIENFTSSTPARGNKPKAASAKKLTNKQRKEQNRRDKAKRDRSAATSDRTSDDGQSDATVVEAAFGCLRI